jgi:ketosteroid isomerase-like protein
MGAIESAATEAMLREVEQFLFREARLLDQQRLDEWLALFAEDATYWVPLERGQKDPWNTMTARSLRSACANTATRARTRGCRQPAPATR